MAMDNVADAPLSLIKKHPKAQPALRQVTSLVLYSLKGIKSETSSLLGLLEMLNSFRWK